MIPPKASGEFVAAMEQVLDVYSRPYDEGHPVVCMDETPRQLIRQVREPLETVPGHPGREDYEYERAGTCNVFVACEPLAGRRIAKVTEYKKRQDWALFLQDIAQAWSGAERITLVMDNLNTHSAASLYETFMPEQAKALRDRFEFVYPPKHGSWLNMAEIEINVLAGQCLDRRIDSLERMRKEVAAWQQRRNQLDAKINWQFTTQDARVKRGSSYAAYIRRLKCVKTLEHFYLIPIHIRLPRSSACSPAPRTARLPRQCSATAPARSAPPPFAAAP